MYISHREKHKTHRIGWLRAAVLGANDGIISTSSLIIGVAAAEANHHAILVAGVAALVAGAMSMAAGEYVSVSSQADSEQAELNIERRELVDDPEAELNELTAIYVDRGLEPELALQVAKQFTAHDALGAHARDELGITDALRARPLQAAISSALSFMIGAILPLLVSIFSSLATIIPFVGISSLFFLACLGGIAAKIGNANLRRGIIRVTFWGMLAMLASAGIGSLFGISA